MDNRQEDKVGPQPGPVYLMSDAVMEDGDRHLSESWEMQMIRRLFMRSFVGLLPPESEVSEVIEVKDYVVLDD